MEVKGDIYRCINVCLPCNLEMTIIMYSRDDDDKDFSRPPTETRGPIPIVYKIYFSWMEIISGKADCGTRDLASLIY